MAISGKHRGLNPEEVYAAFLEEGRNARATARRYGVDPRTVRWHVERVESKDIEHEGHAIPDEARSIDELLKHREKEYARRLSRREATNLVGLNVKMDGPIAIAHIGDPHVDDPDTDILLLRRHLELIRDTRGMFGVNVGDMANNWVGRLARLYGKQTVTEKEAWRLVEWMLGVPGPGKWLYLVGGNHDAWSGDRDPLEYIKDSYGAPLEYHGVRFELRFKNGRKVRVNTRHDFKGHSMWNLAHAPMKAAQLGYKDHILTCGHRHVSAYGVTVDPDPERGVISHCIRVSSYKGHDDYARALGVWAHNISPCCVTVIDPDSKREAGLVTVFWEPEEAAEYLTWKRGKHAA